MKRSGMLAKVKFLRLIFSLLFLHCAYLSAADIGDVLWKFSPEGYNYFESAPAIGKDGTIYVGDQGKNLYAFTPAGKLKWQLPTGGGVHTAPTIAADGTIYIGCWNCGLTAVSPSGFRKWEFAADVADHSGISVGGDGTIYFFCWVNTSYSRHAYPDHTLYAVNPDGTKKWAFPMKVGHYRKPVVTKDKIFVIEGNFYGIENPDSELLALDFSGKLLWRKRGVTTDPAIGADGVLYAGTVGNRLAAISTNGTTLWDTKVVGGVTTTPSIDTNGTLYCGTDDGYVCAVSKQGGVVWTAETSGQVGYCGNMSAAELARLRAKFAERNRPEHPGIRLPVALNTKGEVIVAGHPGVVAFSSAGKKLWEYDVKGRVGGAPAIGADGTIFVGTHSSQLQGALFAIRGSSGLQGSAWPMYGRDPSHTSRAE